MIGSYLVRVVVPTIVAVAVSLTVGAGLGSAAPTTGTATTTGGTFSPSPRVAPINHYYVNATTGPNAAGCQQYVDRANYYLGLGDVNEALISVQKGTANGCVIVRKNRITPVPTEGFYSIG